ncbi:deleted in lung and esophageal cancer protein 1 isoform X1 [Arapaima gigas]
MFEGTGVSERLLLTRRVAIEAAGWGSDPGWEARINKNVTVSFQVSQRKEGDVAVMAEECRRDPGMMGHRAAPESTQDIAHLLAGIFKDLCATDVVEKVADPGGGRATTPSRHLEGLLQVELEVGRQVRDEDVEKHAIQVLDMKDFAPAAVLRRPGEAFSQLNLLLDGAAPSILEGGGSSATPSTEGLTAPSKTPHGRNNRPPQRPARLPKLAEGVCVRQTPAEHMLREQSDFLPALAHCGGKSGTSPTKKVEKGVNGKKVLLKGSIPEEPVPVFLASPPFVVFSDYAVGQVYETTVEMQNVTAASQYLRVIPPATPYFSISLGKFPGEGGVVAPGMSCRYKVRFTPDSLSNFEDVLVVETQSPYPLIVPIEAWRPPPVLTLARVLDCGHCLVGGVKNVEFHCRNEGLGSGTFCILPKKLWPATNFQSVVETSFVEQPPFRITPSLFDLLPGQATVIEVAFFPASPQSFVEVFSIVCDNCQVKDITLQGVGETVTLQLVSVSDGEDYPLPGEVCDPAVDHLVRFGLTNPNCTLQKQLVIRNDTHLKLPFCWQVVKPNLSLPWRAGKEPESAEAEYRLEADGVFDVRPGEGVLQPHQDHEFLLTYHPLQLKDYHSVCHLSLRDIRDLPVGSDTDDTALHRCQVAGVSDVVAMAIELKGSTKPHLVLLEPHAIHFPGENFVGIPIRGRFKMWNLSESKIHFRWDRISDFCVLQVKPLMGEIKTREYRDLEVLLTATRCGPLERSLQCHVESHCRPITLKVQAAFKGPKLTISVPSLDLGLIQLGDQVRSTVHIVNQSRLEASWTLQECDTVDPALESQVTVEPCQGVLPMLTSCSVDVLFKPMERQHFDTVLELAVQNGTGCRLSVTADVQSPQACLLNCELLFTELYVGVPTGGSTTIFNQTLLPVHFAWKEQLWGSQASSCTVSFTPRSGILSANSKLEIVVQFTAHSDVELTEVAGVCEVKGMEDPLVLSFFCKAKNLDVSFSLHPDCPEAADQDQSQLVLDFGDDVWLEREVTRQLAITNRTAIAAPFSVRAEDFAPPHLPPVPPTGDGEQLQQWTSDLRPLPSGLAEKVEKKAKQEFASGLLAHGKGATFFVEPACGTLGPFETQTISITAFTNMWGKYRDRLLCKVGNLEMVFIPMKMEVRGCPLSFQTTGPQVENETQSPVLRFGTHISGGDTVSRSLRLNNPSPFNIYLDWETFNQVKGDKKLLDLIVTYKEAGFPQKDADGNEVFDTLLDPSTSPTSISRDTSSSGGKDSLLSSETASEEHKGINGDPAEDSHCTSVQKLISLYIRPHEGVASDFPYCVTPQKMMVPAGGSSTVHVSFTPQNLSGTTNSAVHLGFALGFLSLGGSGHAAKVERPQSYELPPLKLGLEACVKTPLLSVDMDEEEEALEFLAVASDLLPKDQQKVRLLAVTRTVCLRNTLEMPLYFRLSTQQPFSVLEPQPAGAGKGRLGAREEPRFLVLQPRCCMRASDRVKVAFRSSLSLLTYVSRPSERLPPAVRLLRRGNGERRLCFKNRLLVEHSNGGMQTVPLCAYLVLPTLHLAVSSLDFGICYVGQNYTKEVFLYNKGESGSCWTATVEGNEGAESFTVAPKCGCLNPFEFTTTSCRTPLQISFTPSDTQKVSATVTVKGILGEVPLSLCVRGQGSFDEKFASQEIEAGMKTEG